MDAEKIIKRKKILSSLFFSCLLLVCIITIILGISEKTGKERRKDALMRNPLIKEQLESIRHLISREKKLSEEEYDRELNRIVDRAVKEGLKRRFATQAAEIVFSNLFYDLYLAADVWGITDDNILNTMRLEFVEIANDELELHLDRYMGLIGSKECKKQNDRLYNERLNVFEGHIADDKKELFQHQREILKYVYNMKVN